MNASPASDTEFSCSGLGALAVAQAWREHARRGLAEGPWQLLLVDAPGAPAVHVVTRDAPVEFAEPAPSLRFSSAEARALATACDAVTVQGEAIERHTLILVRGGPRCELIFLPEPSPGRSVRGGRTEAGQEIHCHVALDTGTLERLHFAR